MEAPALSASCSCVACRAGKLAATIRWSPPYVLVAKLPTSMNHDAAQQKSTMQRL